MMIINVFIIDILVLARKNKYVNNKMQIQIYGT
jgi:hypothetical protein